MRILGIDPGIERTGWGIVDVDGGNNKAIDYGCIVTSKNTAFPIRLKEIFSGIDAIIQRHNPDTLAVEEIFFAKNAKSAIIVGHARGVCLLLSGIRAIPLEEVTPLQVKSTLVGYGKATKEQVGLTVKEVLGLPRLPRPDDVCDALAVAITAGIKRSFNARLALAASQEERRNQMVKRKR